jgi:hypothetical protein
MLAASLSFWSLLGCSAHRAASSSQQPTNRLIDETAISNIKAGVSTRADVKAVLGAPWRATNYGETYCGCPYIDLQEVWEYRGADSTGPYKFHIEFDADGVAQILAVAYQNGVVRILASNMPDGPAHSAHHHHHGAGPNTTPASAHAEHNSPSGVSAQARP